MTQAETASQLRLRRQSRRDYTLGLPEGGDGKGNDDSDTSSIDSDMPLTQLRRRSPGNRKWRRDAPTSSLPQRGVAQVKRPRPKKRARRVPVAGNHGSRNGGRIGAQAVVKHDSDPDDPMPLSMLQDLQCHSWLGEGKAGGDAENPIVLDELPPTSSMPTPSVSTRAPSSKDETKMEIDDVNVCVRPLEFVFQRRSHGWDKKDDSPPQSISTAETLFFHAMCNGIATKSTTRLQVAYAGRVYYLCQNNEEYFENIVGEIRDQIRGVDSIAMGYPRVEPYE